ncbi:competence type IV pilus major pilin ComGC [Phosphitispora fastidiosa]|uniref:competence type IV pilus major pilin ComGC n=1 Tax=Phosphitispora fastidiosa TaxID=2837202 RepID=UPI001E2A1676|nr:type II secretion system protein G [Phosphitispora fastidiosa]
MKKGIMIRINRMLKNTRDESGFTLIELLVVIVILGILAAIVVPKIATSSDEAKKSTCETNMNLIDSALQRYYFNESSYPADVSDLADEDYLNVEPECPVTEGSYSISDGKVDRTNHGH